MECRLRAKLKTMIEGLAREHQQELEAAGTFVALEELTCRIGDMVARELTQGELTRRAEALDVQEAKCPDCGEPCLRGRGGIVRLAIGDRMDHLRWAGWIWRG